MKTKALYVLVSNDKDYYLEQAYLSVYSLKLHNPDMCVVALMDDITNKGLVGKREKFLSAIDEKVVIDLDSDWNPIKRSRYLKTSARLHVKGDFLFIDTDTIIVSSLEDIDNCEYDLAAVRDAHTTMNNLYVDRTLELSKKLSVPLLSNIVCFNSGIFYVKDNDRSYSFYKQWNSLWMRGANLGVLQDQPSLNILNQSLDLIMEIDGIWNCQLLRNGLNYFANAKIVHYFNMCTRWKGVFYGNPYYFTDIDLFTQIKSSMEINPDMKDKLLNYSSCFSDRIEVVSGDNLLILHSRQYRMLAYLYVYCNSLFRFFESVLWKVTRLKH